jgi:hypothetical protein
MPWAASDPKALSNPSNIVCALHQFPQPSSQNQEEVLVEEEEEVAVVEEDICLDKEETCKLLSMWVHIPHAH